MSMSKSSKMLQHINYRMRVTIQDGRHLVGNFMAFDRHMNLVLGDCEEHRLLPPSKTTKTASSSDRRTLGLVLLRGEEVVSMTVEGPPPSSDSRSKPSLSTPSANAVSRPAGRGVPPPLSAQPGLSGPIRGVGGPAPNMMQPQIARPPVSYPPPVPVPAGVSRPPGPPPQFMRGPPQQFMRGPPPVYGMGPPPPPGQQGQFVGQRPMPPGMPPQYGMRPGMGPPGGVPMYGPPRQGMPMPPRMPNQQNQNQQQQQ